MIQLLNFVEGIAISKRSAEKLFKTLDMYEALREVIPKMDNLFPADCVNELKHEISNVRTRLGVVAICIFCDLENSLKAETVRNPVPGGAVHPLTRYTMKYLREHSKIERADSTSRPERGEYEAGEGSGNTSGDQSPFYLQLMRKMDLLDSNLETKAKLYKDKIKGSAEINSCIGETWYRRRSSDLRQYHKNYQKETWDRLLQCLSHEGLSVNGKVAKPVLNERFKSFNALFDEIHKTQSTWVVSDEQMQSEVGPHRQAAAAADAAVLSVSHEPDRVKGIPEEEMFAKTDDVSRNGREIQEPEIREDLMANNSKLLSAEDGFRLNNQTSGFKHNNFENSSTSEICQESKDSAIRGEDRAWLLGLRFGSAERWRRA
ncbi:exocyst complex component EXO70C2-like [Malus domestica]|uniref:exocyst complex component EXO70C2-like n=1 Tax=Malus domestica TaxID=3750 RepID=UPI0039771061